MTTSYNYNSVIIRIWFNFSVKSRSMLGNLECFGMEKNKNAQETMWENEWDIYKALKERKICSGQIGAMCRCSFNYHFSVFRFGVANASARTPALTLSFNIRHAIIRIPRTSKEIRKCHIINKNKRRIFNSVAAGTSFVIFLLHTSVANSRSLSLAHIRIYSKWVMQHLMLLYVVALISSHALHYCRNISNEFH